MFILVVFYEKNNAHTLSECEIQFKEAKFREERNVAAGCSKMQIE